MGNTEFGKFVRQLREHRMTYWHSWSRKFLADKSDLDEKQIGRIENGEVADLKRFLEPLAKALDLSELQKAEFYARAGYSYQLKFKQADLDFIVSLLGQIDLPASARTPLWDFVAFNEYHRVMWGYTDEAINILRDGELGSNLLRVYFDEEIRKHQSVVRTSNELIRALSIFRTVSFPYVTSTRYEQIVRCMMETYPTFGQLWREIEQHPNSNIEGYDILNRLPTNKVEHKDYGEVEFMALRVPQRYVGEGVDISVYVPLSDPANQGAFGRMREDILKSEEKNKVHVFTHHPL